MRSTGTTRAGTGAVVAIILVSLLGLCVVLLASFKKRPRIVEAEAIADAYAVPETAAFQPPALPQERYPQISTVVVDHGRLVIGTDGGRLVLSSLDGGTERSIRYPTPHLQLLNIIMPKDDHRYVGADGLYELDDNYCTVLNYYDFGGSVRSLIEFGQGILVGTDAGLWYHCDLSEKAYDCQDTLLLEGVVVTAMAEDRGGLWVGTYGDGLYRWDGRKWQKRFLARDTLAFSFVNALEYKYPFLWVGTDEGLFRYDGGRWAQLFVSDSSDVYDVTCIMSTPAATYIGTEDGLLRFSSGKLKAVKDFEGTAIAGLCLSHKGVIVASRNSGIFTFNGKEEVLSPDMLRPGIAPGSEENRSLAKIPPGTLPAQTDF